MVLEHRTLVHALETLELLRTIETVPNPKVRILRHCEPFKLAACDPSQRRVATGYARSGAQARADSLSTFLAYHHR